MKTLLRLFALIAAATGVVTTNADPLPRPEPVEGPKPESKAKPLFEPGAFFTTEDSEYLFDCLDRVNLSPADLNYDKKIIPQRFVLNVCNKCLDEPLTVPRTTETAAENFGVGRSTSRKKYAAKLLDLPDPSLNLDEHKAHWRELKEIKDAQKRVNDCLGEVDKLKPNPGEQPSDEYKAKQKECKAAYDTGNRCCLPDLFGGQPKTLFDCDVKEGDEDKQYRIGLFGVGADFHESVATLRLGNTKLDAESISLVAALLPQYVSDQETCVLRPRPNLVPETDVLDLAAKSKLEFTLDAASSVGDVMEKLAAVYSPITDKEYAAGKAAKVSGVIGNILGAWEGPWGKFVIGGTGPNTYEGDDFIGIIDLGGDDTYKGRVACGLGLPGKSPVSFVLDLAGNDMYLGEDFTQGFGFLGIGVLWDLGAGNDLYRSRFCAQGCGLLGYGELYDDGGDDIYTADTGAQGAGCFGYGHLIDVKGNDAYRGCRYVQGFAQVRGVGVLTDGAGNDSYYAGGKYLHAPLWTDHYQSLSQGFSIGNRSGGPDGTGGGVAMLLDKGDGNDHYYADIYGQGVSYWFSLGMLVDQGGNDSYYIWQYGMGGGIHLSTGILVDVKGNDSYSDYCGVGHGGAHDYAVGWLIDREGNDLYQGNGQGQGLNFSIGIMLDCAGDDSHCTGNDGSIGKGSNNSISLMIDLAGTDFYGPKEIKDGAFTRRAAHEMVYDVPEGWFVGIDESTLPTKQTPAPELTTVEHILISYKGIRGAKLKDPERTEADAEALAKKVLNLTRKKGADWKALQVEYNEDTLPHSQYDCTPSASLVQEFKDLGLSLGVGQIGITRKGTYGWHIIKRVK
ncbi:MAG: peptidylprolyl isomerase [Planctomycetes bacterium]|nr:peptidylprolyl isomerase [Planctomycetota bacterium]